MTHTTMRTMAAAAVATAVITTTGAAIATAGSAGPDAPGTGRLVPCPTDEGPDGQGYPCVYDGRHLGNGAGRSFVITPPAAGETYGRIVFVPHYVAHALIFGSYGEGSPRH